MDPILAKAIAASTGATLTVLTMTPFDVVKTRLQTQLPQTASQSGLQTCLQPPHLSCVRKMSSLAAHSPIAASRPSLASLSGLKPPIQPPELCVRCYEGGSLRAHRVNGFWDALIKVARVEGVRGLWKGVGTTMLIAIPSQSAYMVTYDRLLNKILPPLSPYAPLTPLLAGITARTIISTVASPLELLRTSLQSTPASFETPNTLKSVLKSARTLVRADGLTALWRGLVPTLWRDVPFSGIYWASYESWKGTFRRRYKRSGVLYEFLSGAISGITAALITHPFDVAKTRRQALVLKGGVPASMTRLLAQIVRKEGFTLLFAGLTPRLAKIAPACGIMIASYEGVGRYLMSDAL